MIGKPARSPRLPRAFAELSATRRRRTCWLLLVAISAQLRVFLGFEREMKRTGGPGIIGFELAGSPARAREILATWGEEGRAAPRKSLLLDSVFPPSYAVLQALACETAAEGLGCRRRRGFADAGLAIGWGQLAAAGFDYVENTALLLTPERPGRAGAAASR